MRKVHNLSPKLLQYSRSGALNKVNKVQGRYRWPDCQTDSDRKPLPRMLAERRKLFINDRSLYRELAKLLWEGASNKPRPILQDRMFYPRGLSFSQFVVLTIQFLKLSL